MGLIDDVKSNVRDSPYFPDEMACVYNHFKRLRFGRAVGEEVVTLIQRGSITYTEIDSYNNALPVKLTHSEVELIMDIDSIFEAREVTHG